MKFLFSFSSGKEYYLSYIPFFPIVPFLHLWSSSSTLQANFQANLIYTITKHTAKYGDQFYYTISTSLPFDIVINEVDTGYDDYQFEGNVPIEYSSYWTISANTLQSNTEFMEHPTVSESSAVYYEILGKRYENPSSILVTYNQKEYRIKIQ